MTDTEVVSSVDRLLETQTFGEIAVTLNRSGLRSGKGHRFTPRYIARIQKQYRLRSRFGRLSALGMLTLTEIATQLAVCSKTVKIWAAHGLLKAHAYTDKPEYLYEPPRDALPQKAQGRKLSDRAQAASFVPECPKEVQCEA